MNPDQTAPLEQQVREQKTKDVNGWKKVNLNGWNQRPLDPKLSTLSLSHCAPFVQTIIFMIYWCLFDLIIYVSSTIFQL